MKEHRRGWGWLAVWLLFFAAPGAFAQPRVEVIVEGVSGEIRDTVFANLSLYRERGHPLLSEHRIQRLHQRAPDEIRNALRPFGYYSPGIDSAISHEGDLWRVRYVVETGKPVRVRSVELILEGPAADDPVLKEWRDNFPLAEGDILLDPLYEDAKNALQRLGRERGYLDGFLAEHEVRVHTGDLSAEIRLRYVSGPRMRFGALTFGEVPLRESFLKRYAGFEPGDPYDAEKIYQLHRDLINSDYFARVDVVPRTETLLSGEVPVEVELEMRKRDRYTAGIGFGTDTGARASLGFERRWLNSYGHRLSSEALVSDVRQSVVANYRIPLDVPTTDFLGITAGREREETDVDVATDTSTVAANVTHQLGRWLRTVSLNYLEENFEVGDTNTRSTMFYPGLNVQRVETDDRFFPSRGWRVMADVRVAGDDYWSSTALVQGRLSGKAVIPLLGGRFMPRFDVASSYVSDFDRLPPTLRFFAGGDQSVRGFAYKSLGPVDSAGDVVGGSNLLTGSVEYDYFVSRRFGLALFSDVGNAFNSFDDYELHQGAGAGVRWRLPFGVIRLDVAWAVSDEEKPWRIHFTIGPDL